MLIAILGSFHFNVVDVELPIAKEPSSDRPDIKNSKKGPKTTTTSNSQENVTAFGFEEEDLEDEMELENDENVEDEKPDAEEDDDEEEEEDGEKDVENEEEMEVDGNLPTGAGEEAGKAKVEDVVSTEEHQIKAKQKILDYMVNKVLPRLRQSLHASVCLLMEVFTGWTKSRMGWDL